MTEIQRDPLKVSRILRRWLFACWRIIARSYHAGLAPSLEEMQAKLEAVLLPRFVRRYRKGVASVEWPIRKKAFFGRVAGGIVSGLEAVKQTVKATVQSLADWVRKRAATAILAGALAANPTPEDLPASIPMMTVYDAAHETEQTGIRDEAIRSGAEGLQWHTKEDERVCVQCGPLDGKIVKIGEPFGVTKNGQPIYAPTVHRNCRCWLRAVYP